MNIDDIDDQLNQELEKHLAELRASDEFKEPVFITKKSYVDAVAYGILAGDIWFKNYKVPEGFESVLNWVAFNASRKFADEVLIETTLNDACDFLTETLYEHPIFKSWLTKKHNYSTDVVYSLEAPDRDFIPFGPIMSNIIVSLQRDAALHKPLSLIAKMLKNKTPEFPFDERGENYL